jgi:methionine-rich copper-binding protein CopC
MKSTMRFTMKSAMKSTMKTLARVAATAPLAVALLITSGVASDKALAHAEVVSVSPTNGAVLAAPPSSVSISFNEPVSTTAAKLQLVNSTGVVVKASFTASRTSDRFTLTPKAKLAKGSYAVRYAVVSADGHIVTGASSFSVAMKPAAGSQTVKVVASDATTAQLNVGVSAGPMNVSHSLGQVVSIEFRHSKLAAPLTVSAVSPSSVVLPMKGEWSVTVVQRVSSFKELRMVGKFTLR